MATFTRAVKHEARLRMALAGPAGAGKTYTAMILASVLAEGQPFAVIDTEHGSASKYADLFTFDVLELESFHPDRYVEAIHEAEAAGYSVLVIDSLSHAWSGKDGILEQVERLTKLKHANNTFRAWADATPIQNRFIDALTGANLHILATMRSKTEYVVETNERGKATPRKVGMAPIQREGVEYEFDLFGELDQENTLVIHKSRCPALSGAVIARPGPSVAKTLQAWLRGTPRSEAETPAMPMRIQASVTPVREAEALNAEDSERTESTQDPEGMDGGQRDDEGQKHHEGARVARSKSSVKSSSATSTSASVASAFNATSGAVKTLTERAHELGYEGEAWMSLVYRITGKREPRELTGQDKAKLATYLGHLAKLASRPQIVRDDEERESKGRGKGAEQDERDGQIGA